MTWLDRTIEPTETELWAIEAEAQELAAELTLAGAEAAFYERPNADTAAAYVRALLDLVDLHDFAGHQDHWPKTPAFSEVSR